ncbi:MAG: oligosaccharide flippase family protein [Dehalococcoidia bacterium]
MRGAGTPNIGSESSQQTIWNALTGAVAFGWPIGLSLILTPLMLRGLGSAEFGLRTLVLSVLAYFGLLDFGINVAITKYLAEYLAQGDIERVQRLLGTTLTLFLGIGLFGTSSIALATPWLIDSLLQVPSELRAEGFGSLYLVAGMFLVNALIWWASSIPAGLQRYDVVNSVQLFAGSIASIGAVAAALAGMSLTVVVAASLVGMGLQLVLFLILRRRLLPHLKVLPRWDRDIIRRTTTFGLSILATRIAGLIFTYVDKLLIGIWFGLSMVTYWAIPATLALYIHQLCARVLQLLFPMASALSLSPDGPASVTELFCSSLRLNALLASSVALPLFVVGESRCWFIGSVRSLPVHQWWCCGF